MLESARTFGELTRLIASASDRREVFDAVSRAAATLLGAKMARVWIDDPEARLLRAHGNFGSDPTDQRLMAEFSAIPYGSGMVSGLFESRVPTYLPDVQKEPRWLNQRLAQEGNLHAFAGIPLISGDRVVGVLAILFGKRRQFTPQEKELMGLLADHAAIAINNARLHEEAERRRQETEALARLARDISAPVDLDTILRRVGETAKALCAADLAWIALSEPGSNRMAFRYWPGARYEGYDRLRIEPGKGIGGRVLATGRPFRTDHYAEDPRISKDYLDVARAEGVVAAMVAPIRGEGRIEGLLYVENRSPRPFTDRDEATLLGLADHAAIAMRNASLFEETSRRRKAAEALAEVGQAIAQSLDLEEVGQRIVDSVRSLFGAKYSTLFQLEPGSGALVVVAGSAEAEFPFPPNQVFPKGTGATGLAVRDREVVITPDVLDDPRITLTPEVRGRIEQAGYGAVLAVPLLVQDRAIGALGLGDRKGRVFTDEETRLVQAFADRAAWALENARLHREVQDRLRQTETLLAVGQAVGSTLDLTETMRRVARQTGRALGADMVGAYLADADKTSLRPIAGYHVPEHLREAFRAFPIPLKGHRLLEEALARQKPLCTSDVTADLRVDRQTVERFPHRSLLFVPITVKGEAIGGLFVVWWERPYECTPEELRLVEGISVHAAGALENARLYQQTQEAYDELSRTQEQLNLSQKMEAVGRLAGGIAHDFNNLMTIITGRAEMLLGRLRPDDPLHRDIELFRKTSARAAAVTRQLLAFSRKQVLQPKVLDLNAVVAGMGSMLRRLIGEDIDLVTVLEPALWCVRADPGQLEQVILNLAVNARDAMPNGGKLTIETGNVELDEGYASRHVAVKPGSFVLLAMSDTGMGMDEATRSRIFEPFFTTKEQGEGTGLGLATVYGIVKQSGGSIWVYSEPGQGTAFKIYLPRVDEAVESLEPAPPAAAPQRGSETVLLVEDEDELRSVAREMLEMYGYTVLEADHPDEALLKAERHSGPIHLLVTDVVMPKMSGRDLAQRLAPLRPEMRVLYVSGYTDDAIVHHGVLDPGMAFLEKPFNPDELARKVREVLDQA